MKNFNLYLFFLSFLLIVPDLTIASGDPVLTVRTLKSLPVLAGDEVTVVWNCKNAKKLYCYELSDNALPLKGSLSFKPETNITLNFVAEKGKKQKKRKLFIEVLYPEFEKVNIPKSITDEEISSFNWLAKNADYVLIEGFDDKFDTMGKLPLISEKDTAIKITAVNKNGIQSTTIAKVSVTPYEYLNYPTRVSKGSEIKVSWGYKNTENIKIDGITDNMPASGDVRITMYESKTFKLHVYRKDGTWEIKDIKIDVYESEIKEFTGTARFFAGEEVSLLWEVRNADSVTLSCTPDKQALKGVFRYKPEKTENVILTAWLNGIPDTRAHKVELLKRRFISSEKLIGQIQYGQRLDYEIFAVDLDEYPKLIKLFVLVVDTAGNFVHGLAPPNISETDAKKYFMGLTESYISGKSAEINDFKVVEIAKNTEMARNISVVLDYSGSMCESIKELEKSVLSFINNKRDIDSISIVKFDSDVQLESKLDKDKAILSRLFKISGLNEYGKLTALYAAMGEGLNSVKSSEIPTEMIVFTDGWENSSIAYLGSLPVTAHEVVKMAENNNVRMNIISFGPGCNDRLLELMAQYSGGYHYNILNSDDINAVWTELPFLNSNYYIISFKPGDISKINGIRLKYNDNTGNSNVTGRNLYMNTPVDFNSLESGEFAYWTSCSNLYQNKTPVGLPQVLALFDLNGSMLKDEYQARVDNLKKIMDSDEELFLVVFGHTDQSDTEDYNLELSEKRCKAVSQHLIDAGISEDRIINIPLGEEFPVWKDEDEGWKAQENRRIETLFVK
ncbi:MAG TPA: OmpA family protein [Bacteroidales bacterium]|nr:OmpA family protein [Bacteroidales bacterium]